MEMVQAHPRFTTLQNYTTLKLSMNEEGGGPRFTTLQNYTTLKLTLQIRID